MSEKLKQYILDKKHHVYRCECPVNFADDFAKMNLSPLERMTRRFETLCELEIPVILEDEKICCLRTIKNIPDCFTDEELEKLSETYSVFRTANLAPNYYKAINNGLISLMETADEYGKRTINAVIALADKYKNEALRVNRMDIATVFERIPRYGATNFREALQMFRLLHFALWLDGGHQATIGRFDKHIYPYLKKDLENGVLTEESALELLEDFFISFNKDSDLYPGIQQGDNGQSMMLGGVDENGNDVYNHLSELCFKASYNNELIDPKLNIRVSKNTPIERFAEATRLTKAGLGFPQYTNDDIVIPALEKLGYEHKDATDYTAAACWEIIIPGYGNEIVNIGVLSFPEAVDNALHNDLKKCDTFDEFFGCVKKEIGVLTDRIHNGIREIYYIPSPFMNVLMDCDTYDVNSHTQKGKYVNFGLHGAGIATAADSLAVIKKYVFEEKSLGKDELISAVDENFENTPELLHKLRYDAPKMGNNDDYVDSIAVELLDSYSKAVEGKKNVLGGIYRAGTGTAMFYLLLVEKMGASPDGRRKGEPFGTNFSVSLFANVKGPVSVIASMTKPNFVNAANGGPLTLEFHGSVFAEESGIEKVATLVKTFIDRGGHQLQLNTLNVEELLDAKAHPEKHRQLIVRVWGWSGYFVELDEVYQNHIISRQVYSV